MAMDVFYELASVFCGKLEANPLCFSRQPRGHSSSILSTAILSSSSSIEPVFVLPTRVIGEKYDQSG